MKTPHVALDLFPEMPAVAVEKPKRTKRVAKPHVAPQATARIQAELDAPLPATAPALELLMSSAVL